MENVKIQKSENCLESSLNDLPENSKLNSLMKTALDNAANSVVITDIDGNIKWVNRAFTDFTGYSKAEALNQNPRVLKSGYNDNSLYENLWNTVLSGNVWSGDIINKRKDGSTYIEDMTITPVKNEAGEITNFIAIKQDISRVYS